MGIPRWVTKGRPVAIELGQEIPAPPEIVWELVTDWERQGEWMLEARDFEVLTKRREGVGVEARAMVRIGGITTRDRVRVTAWELHERLMIRHMGWVSGEAEMYLTPVGISSSYLLWREELEPPLGLLGGIGLRMFEPLLRRVFARDLRVLAELGRRQMLEANPPA